MHHRECTPKQQTFHWIEDQLECTIIWIALEKKNFEIILIQVLNILNFSSINSIETREIKPYDIVLNLKPKISSSDTDSLQNI